MKEIKFDLSKWEEPADKMNAVYSFIVNRAAALDPNIYPYICFSPENNARGCVAYYVATAITTCRRFIFYVPKSVKKYAYFSKNKKIKPISKWRFNRKMRNSESMTWQMYPYDNCSPCIFEGIPQNYINDIAELLFNFKES